MAKLYNTSVAIGANAASSNANSIAIGGSTGYSTAQVTFHVPATPVQLETCIECGAFVNTASPEKMALHREWHERVNLLLQMLDPARAQQWADARRELEETYRSL